MGSLLGREHASTPQSGVEAPRLLKRSLPRLYYCCCCCFCKLFTERGVYGPQPATDNWQEPSTTKNSSSSRAPKTGAQLRDDPEERGKKPNPHRHQTLDEAHCLNNWNVHRSGDELSLRHLQQEPRRRCISTGTSTTVDELHKQGHRPP